VNNETILKKLDKLVGLVEETSPTEPDSRELFDGHLVEVEQMKLLFDHAVTGYPASDQIVEMMKRSNEIWKVRKRYKDNGGQFTIEHQEMVDSVEDFVTNGQKINAIKLYRTRMKELYDEKLGLREAKNYVDSVQDDLIKKGVIK
jgi:ribosomal protein L7/L12